MIDAYLIEFQDVSAGLAARGEDGFLFISSDERFDRLHGRTFADLAALEREVARILRRAEREGVVGSALKARPEAA